MKPEMEGRYTVDLVNKSELEGVTNFRATEEAWAAYEALDYHLLIEIYENDAKETEAVSRPVIYNFPQEYVRRGEIMAIDPQPAKFTVKAVTE